MIQKLDAASQRFLADLQRIQSAAERAQREVTSGLKVEQPSDAPDSVTDILQVRSELGLNSQIQTNLALVKGEVDTADSVLQSAVNLLDNARALAAQGAGTLADASERSGLAMQVQSILQQMVGISATTVAGRYIFGGDRDTSAPYQIDAGGVKQLTTGSATRQIVDINGVGFSPALTAQEIFDLTDATGNAAAGNVFAALSELKTALESNDSTGIGNAVTSLDAAGVQLNSALSYYGNTQNRVNQAIGLAKKFEVQQKSQLSGLQDADLLSASTDLSQLQVQQQAALTAQANRSRHSLFEYLG